MNKQASDETFGQWLKRKRGEQRITQETLAERAKISPAYVSAIERNQRHTITNATNQPTVKVIDRIAEVLGAPLAEARTVAGYAVPPVEKLERSFAAEEAASIIEAMSEQEQKLALAAVKLIRSAAEVKDYPDVIGD